MQGAVDLIASAKWKTEYLELFQSQLKTIPRMHQVGDVQHLELPQEKQCIDLCIQLIEQILDAHGAACSTV